MHGLQKRRRIMEEFRIDEISAVDRPAQEHAKAVLMKRIEPTDYSADPADFDQAVVAVRHANKSLGYTAALTKARIDYPALYEHSQRRGEAAYDAAITKMRTYKGVEKTDAMRFMMKVDAYISKNGGTRTAAMTAVRLYDPEAFSRFVGT